MGILNYIRFLLSYRHSVYKLRKKYDHIREKADRQTATKRLASLRALDQVEPTLVMLEEQSISAFDRSRLARFVTQGIENAERILKEKYAAEVKK